MQAIIQLHVAERRTLKLIPQVGWTFTKRVALSGPEAVESVLIQVVVLDDLIEEDDKRYGVYVAQAGLARMLRGTNFPLVTTLSSLMAVGAVSRVDVAEGEERRNLVFEYNIAEDAIYGVAEGATSVRPMHSTTAS